MTAICHRYELPVYCELLEAENQRFIEVTRGVDPDAPVPSCPDWTVRTVVDHVGGLHRWAEAIVRLLSDRRIRGKELDLDTPTDPDGWEAWLNDGLSKLVAALGSQDPDAEVWTWGSDRHVRFWGRRMLFETTIHRVDLELARGMKSEVEQGIAADGIDEFLDNLPHAVYFAPQVKELRGTGERIRLHATDIDLRWTIELFRDGFDWHHSSDEPNVRVEGSASDLLLFIYGRKDPSGGALTAIGHQGILERWRTNSAI